ncbi:protein RGF1 INDUCIBLE TRANSCRIPTION FACTOR 1-like [Phragmites australis]|uniref:protein RGF1 INDUCIBLE TRANSCRIPTION FACTOR 1-like n=1 Tax=Phragmites australis TaxID=29695 RepID=UPI002D780505|nr:protein RGF1 INDUCIBLE TRANSCRIPTION FACTOR 1-like [Phragmites australis]
MAIDHESPFKELRLKNRRIMGGGGPEPEEEAASAAAAVHGEQWPRWLGSLLSARFFAHCKTHADSHRSGECNMFCLDCSAAAPGAAGAGALCSLCLAHGHRDHQTIQIRRSSYHDVIRVSDIQRFMDIAGVQTYVINGARVVFLNERPQQQKPGGGGGKAASASANLCEVCARSLLDNFRFCSLGCKVVGCSPDAAKARNRLIRSSDGSTSSSSLRNADKKQSFTPPTPPTLPAKRRKGIPHRAPFGSLIVEY